jgi:hypothetical protein
MPSEFQLSLNSGSRRNTSSNDCSVWLPWIMALMAIKQVHYRPIAPTSKHKTEYPQTSTRWTSARKWQAKHRGYIPGKGTGFLLRDCVETGPTTHSDSAGGLSPQIKQLLLAHAGSSLADFSILKMGAIRSSETSVHFTGSTRCHIQEDGILHSHRCENLKSYNTWNCILHRFSPSG